MCIESKFFISMWKILVILLNCHYGGRQFLLVVLHGSRKTPSREGNPEDGCFFRHAYHVITKQFPDARHGTEYLEKTKR